MPPIAYRRIREQGVTFVFKYDVDAPHLLHIFARHLTEPDDALDVWFDPTTTQSWNEDHQRFERLSKTHGLFWLWLEPFGVVMVITCFRLEVQDEQAP